MAAAAVLLLLPLLLAGALGQAPPVFNRTRKSKVERLPGWNGPLPSDQYTGYISVHGGDRHLFYWLVSSQVRPATDPVVLWLTGGPGCSGLDAFVYEHGPFTFTEGDHSNGGIRLTRNPHTWAKAATVIYVDSPIGTGLSYADASDAGGAPHMDDDSTTDDLLQLIASLLQEQFPHLLRNPLYIAGESYAGVYVPLLVSKMLRYNRQAGFEDRLNLQGYAIGNGVTDDVFDGNAQPEFAYGMGLIDPPTYTQLRAACSDSFWNATPGGACAVQLREAYDKFYWVNPYDILLACYMPPRDGAPVPGQGRGGHALPALRAHAAIQPTRREGGGLPPLGAAIAAGGEGGLPPRWPFAAVRSGASGQAANWHQMLGHSVPCADRRIALAWLNRRDVREAIHAPPASHLEWQPCSDTLSYDFTPVSMIPHHLHALRHGVRALVYSGDHDFVVPFTGTRAWVYSLGLDTLLPYATWTTADGQVAGFWTTFTQGLSYATVLGAGHMVPQSRPRAALTLIERFLFPDGDYAFFASRRSNE